jgi:hypothetical protein
MPVRRVPRKKTGPFRPTSDAKATFGSPGALLGPFLPSQWQAPKQKPKSEKIRDAERATEEKDRW